MFALDKVFTVKRIELYRITIVNITIRSNRKNNKNNQSAITGICFYKTTNDQVIIITSSEHSGALFVSTAYMRIRCDTACIYVFKERKGEKTQELEKKKV